jgi:hypothetical protein
LHPFDVNIQEIYNSLLTNENGAIEYNHY